MERNVVRRSLCAAVCLFLTLSLCLSACGEVEPEVGRYLCVGLMEEKSEGG